MLYRLKKYIKSIKELKNIIKLSNSKEAYFLLGFINIDLKKYEEALLYFNKILSYDDIEIYLKLATLKNKGNVLYKKDNLVFLQCFIKKALPLLNKSKAQINFIIKKLFPIFFHSFF